MTRLPRTSRPTRRRPYAPRPRCACSGEPLVERSRPLLGEGPVQLLVLLGQGPVQLVALFRERPVQLLTLVHGCLLGIPAAGAIAVVLGGQGAGQGQHADAGRDPRSDDRRVHTRNLAHYGRVRALRRITRCGLSRSAIGPPAGPQLRARHLLLTTAALRRLAGRRRHAATLCLDVTDTRQACGPLDAFSLIRTPAESERFGSQTGSQRPQPPGDTRPQPARIRAC
jgi:hypothetical protein